MRPKDQPFHRPVYAEYLERKKKKKSAYDLKHSQEKRKTHLQIRARMSPLPVANRLPVGLGATEMTIPS